MRERLMLDRLDRNRSKAMADAITSPSALLLAGVGASAAILAGAPVVAAAVVGAAAWAVRVAIALPKRPREERIDVRSLGDPWRGLVRSAQDAHARFERALRMTNPGPVRDHLADVARRVAVGVRECWGIAKRGDALDDALRELDIAGTRQKLDAVRAELGHGGARPELQETADALQAQLDSGTRLQSVAQGALDRLRRLDAQLDEAVARALELSLHAADSRAVQPLGDDVDTVVGELESLRLGLEESTRLGQGRPLPPSATAV
jgi:hypothetical protein